VNETTTYNSLARLIEPDPIAYSFNTPGWYFLFVLLTLFLLLFAAFQYWKYKKNAYRRAAQKQIEMLLQQNHKNFVYEVNFLLKKMAIRHFGRKKVASLYGEEWINFLHSTTPSQSISSTRLFPDFTNALYNSSFQLSKAQKNEFTEFALLWVTKHDVKNV